PERLRVEDDEPRVDATPAERLHVRPADAGEVDRAMRDAEGHRPGSIVRSLHDHAVEEEADLVPALDLAAVAAAELHVDGLAFERPGDVGELWAAVDLRARSAFRDRCEWIVDPCELAARLGGVGDGAARGAAQGRERRRLIEVLDGDGDLEVGSR